MINMILVLGLLLLGIALIIWAIRDGIKNPPPKANVKDDEYYEKLDKIWKVCIYIIAVIIMVGFVCARIYIKKDLERMVQEYGEVIYEKTNKIP